MQDDCRHLRDILKQKEELIETLVGQIDTKTKLMTSYAAENDRLRVTLVWYAENSSHPSPARDAITEANNIRSKECSPGL